MWIATCQTSNGFYTHIILCHSSSKPQTNCCKWPGEQLVEWQPIDRSNSSRDCSAYQFESITTWRESAFWTSASHSWKFDTSSTFVSIQLYHDLYFNLSEDLLCSQNHLNERWLLVFKGIQVSWVFITWLPPTGSVWFIDNSRSAGMLCSTRKWGLCRHLNNNSFSGTIPHDLGRLQHLNHL